MIPCNNCHKIVYCGAECRERDFINHENECQNIEKFDEQTEILQLLIKGYSLFHKTLSSDGQPFDNQKTLFMNKLYKIFQDINNDKDFIKLNKFCWMFDEVLRVCQTVFGTMDNPLGFAIYQGLSEKLSHSCVPNADISFSGNQLTLSSRVSRRRKEEDRILVSFVDTSLRKSARAEELNRTFGISCECYKCDELGHIEDKIKRSLREEINFLKRNFVQDVESLTEGKNRDYFYSIRY